MADSEPADAAAEPIVDPWTVSGKIDYGKLIEQFQDGAPMLLLESTGGVAQAFAYVMKAVRMMRPRWDIDFVLRLVTEYARPRHMLHPPRTGSHSLTRRRRMFVAQI